MFDLTADDVTAGATALGIAVAIWQVFGIRDEARKERTLAICNRYDSDEVLNKSVDAVFKFQSGEDTAKKAKDMEPDVVRILNYLDSVAIGIDESVYSEDIVREHLKHIARIHIGDLLLEGNAERFGIDISDYPALLSLHRRWEQPAIYSTWVLGSDA